MAEHFSNDIATTLNGTITSGATSLVVASSTGFPAANFRVRIDDEYLLVTVVAGTTWTVTRAMESSTAAAHSNGAAVTHVLTAGGLVQAVAEANSPLLSYTETTNTLNGAAISASVYFDVIANQTFIVGDANSIIEVVVLAGMIITTATVNTLVATRILIDSAGTPVAQTISSDILAVAGGFVNPMTGNAPVYLTGLAAGSHTIKLQGLSTIAGTAYCRCASTPGSEFVTVKVVEHRRA